MAEFVFDQVEQWHPPPVGAEVAGAHVGRATRGAGCAGARALEERPRPTPAARQVADVFGVGHSEHDVGLARRTPQRRIDTVVGGVVVIHRVRLAGLETHVVAAERDGGEVVVHARADGVDDLLWVQAQAQRHVAVQRLGGGEGHRTHPYLHHVDGRCRGVGGEALEQIGPGHGGGWSGIERRAAGRNDQGEPGDGGARENPQEMLKSAAEHTDTSGTTVQSPGLLRRTRVRRRTGVGAISAVTAHIGCWCR